MGRKPVNEAVAAWYRSIPYSRVKLPDAQLDLLRYVPAYKRAGKKKNENRVANVWIMLDTETSKKHPNKWDKDKPLAVENHVVLYTISIRVFHHNLMTIYGRTPSEAVQACKAIHDALPGDETIIFIHNASYDWVFLRKFFIRDFGKPIKQLNTKSHYPVLIQFENGITLRDSLILAQRRMEKWADDLQVEHRKAVGFWDYEKIRNQDTALTDDELTYAECDTLAGVECLDTLASQLHKYVYSLPYTATGIVREACRKEGKKEKAHDAFIHQALTFEQYMQLQNVFHGGYTHGSRDFVNRTITGRIEAYDFTSSYPYEMLVEKYPCEKFWPADEGMTISDILNYSDDYAFFFELVADEVRLKDLGEQMPVLQASKCIQSINAVVDNGRILKAAFVDIWLTEQDLIVIAEQYDFGVYRLRNVQCAAKDYLPRWFRDFVFQKFQDKCRLKGGDPVAYSLAKGSLNSLYGMTVQKALKDNIIEDYDTGEHYVQPDVDAVAYDKYVKRFSSFLPYQWGTWVTAYAMLHLFRMAKCCGTWLYSDTDSSYGLNWDHDALDQLNREARQKLLDAGYGPVVIGQKEFWLGVAALDGVYSEFRFQGAKRYVVRDEKSDKLKITIAGIPKKGVAALEDDIDNFVPGLIFPYSITGKTTHSYIFIDDIYIDENGNETGDSIDLMPCPYKLDTIEQWTFDQLINEELSIIGIL